MTQLYPALDAATEAALRASIRRFGVLLPIVVDQHGEILDGHHRSRIAGELGVEYPMLTREVEDEDEAREIARTLNEDRRMLTREQRLPVVKALREEGHSQRAISRALGVALSTVQDDEKKAGDRGRSPARVTGLDGKSYPATREQQSEKNGRRTYRKDRTKPFAIKSQRAAQVAGGHRRRLEDGLSQINGICRGLRDLDLHIAGAAMTADEIGVWIAKTGELSRFLRDLKSSLTEVRDGRA